jgi:hypothetical protein
VHEAHSRRGAFPVEQKLRITADKSSFREVVAIAKMQSFDLLGYFFICAGQFCTRVSG